MPSDIFRHSELPQRISILGLFCNSLFLRLFSAVFQSHLNHGLQTNRILENYGNVSGHGGSVFVIHYYCLRMYPQYETSRSDK